MTRLERRSSTVRQECRSVSVGLHSGPACAPDRSGTAVQQAPVELCATRETRRSECSVPVSFSVAFEVGVARGRVYLDTD